MATRLLKLRPYGMFSNVNEVIQNLHLAEQAGDDFVIDWSASPYGTKGPEGDPWGQYFDHPFPEARLFDGIETLPTGGKVLCVPESIICPTRAAGECDTMHMPFSLAPAHDIITRHIRLSAAMRAGVEAAAKALLTRPTVGLHLRGPRGVDGGAAAFRAGYGSRWVVPYERYWEAGEKAMSELGAAHILVCTDSSESLALARERFGDRMISYDALRSARGDMHTPNLRDAEMADEGFRLGQDVITEVWLLSRCAAFVHGRSNIANFVRAKSPDMPSIFAYDPALTLRRGSEDTGAATDFPPAPNGARQEP